MIDNYLLEELAVFAKTRTLAQTAEQLNVTQPTVTRGMQKLEDDFGVRLFDRQPNRIKLTETGELAAAEATKLIKLNLEMIDRIKKFDYSQHSIRIGSMIPGPLILLNHLHSVLPDDIQVEKESLSGDKIEQQLMRNDYSLIFSNQEILTSEIESQYVGTENLQVNLDQFMFQANQSTVHFQELKNLSFIVLREIGSWRDIIQKEIPGAKFLYQEQRDAFADITKYSNFPYFTTNLSQYDTILLQRKSKNDDRVTVPIWDESAKMVIYVSYLTKQKQRLTPIMNLIRDSWPN
ncbi:LysR family transcriptional regulator [Pediococcus ethanolidurans]|uniref:LysR family transcriptional regulator n=1 Tax=Pediococcus ethanolidurans TaxID=319653 RepID=UPI0029532FA8|nr:LysR family transcriptional regulator [Pediococcus ethanolidurans]MDV7719506.1 LysR family transcriptional regulator [Pediococcus ethanolidurans]